MQFYIIVLWAHSVRWCNDIYHTFVHSLTVAQIFIRLSLISFCIVFSSDMISSACCFVKKIIKSREFSRTSLCRLWLIFWNRHFETISRAILIFWILFCDFLIRALLKNILFLNFVSVVIILFRSSLILFFYFLFVESNFSFQWRFLNDFIISFKLSESNECFHFFLKLDCLQASIVERSIILMKHFFRDTSWWFYNC